MEEFINYQDNIYGEYPKYDMFGIDDNEFIIDCLIKSVRIRPFSMENVVSFCRVSCNNPVFKRILLQKSVRFVPLIAYKLFNEGVYNENEILQELNETKSVFPCMYFHDFLSDIRVFCQGFEDFNSLDDLLIEELDVFLENGFHPNSLEYFLKYDDFPKYQQHISTLESLGDMRVKWSAYEWSLCPFFLTYSNIDPLEFSSFFGSAKCFKALLMSGYNIDSSIQRCVVMSGNIELFRATLNYLQPNYSLISTAAAFSHKNIISFIHSNYKKSDETTVNLPLFPIIRFIWQHLKDISISSVTYSVLGMILMKLIRIYSFKEYGRTNPLFNKSWFL